MTETQTTVTTKPFEFDVLLNGDNYNIETNVFKSPLRWDDVFPILQEVVKNILNTPINRNNFVYFVRQPLDYELGLLTSLSDIKTESQILILTVL